MPLDAYAPNNDGSRKPYWPHHYVTVDEMFKVRALLEKSGIIRYPGGRVPSFDYILAFHLPRVFGKTEAYRTLEPRAQTINTFYTLAAGDGPDFSDRVEDISFWQKIFSCEPEERQESLREGLVRNNVIALLNRFAETADERTEKELGISIDDIKALVREINETILTNHKSRER